MKYDKIMKKNPDFAQDRISISDDINIIKQLSTQTPEYLLSLYHAEGTSNYLKAGIISQPHAPIELIRLGLCSKIRLIAIQAIWHHRAAREALEEAARSHPLPSLREEAESALAKRDACGWDNKEPKGKHSVA